MKTSDYIHGLRHINTKCSFYIINSLIILLKTCIPIAKILVFSYAK